ncbi:hypothetical protein GIB67_012219 [Kingdonia uniflora]|uniref:PH domain-containing protein n=1 Tax=Kingdonia uniflora TaxID=39325 RepID=A0A7J7NVB6_9MAGN|nr:hypothetical protein GIB67_012219 [Kingdonia uniflora]
MGRKLCRRLQTAKNVDINFVDIVRGTSYYVNRYKKYFANEFLFVTKDYEATKQYQNSGVNTSAMTTFRSSCSDKNTNDKSTVYYGVLEDFIELQYREGYKAVLFKCVWAKIIHYGVKVDVESNLTLVNLSNLIRSDHMADEPFILAEHTIQVFHSKDPKDPDWHVVLQVPSKVYVDDEACLLSGERVLSDSDIGPKVKICYKNISVNPKKRFEFLEAVSGMMDSVFVTSNSHEKGQTTSMPLSMKGCKITKDRLIEKVDGFQMALIVLLMEMAYKTSMCDIIQVQTIRQGYLSKRSSSLRGDWKRWFFELDSQGMLYYYRKQSSKPL